MPSLLENPLHLGLGASAIPQPPITGIDWYQGYEERNGHDGAEGRLVSMHRFSESWDSWEMHPLGDEVVLCVSGRMTLYQEHVDGTEATIILGPNDYAVNSPGTWHTADIFEETLALFITAGAGTEHRPR